MTGTTATEDNDVRATARQILKEAMGDTLAQANTQIAALQAKCDRLEGVVAFAMGAIAAMSERRPDTERLVKECTENGHYASVLLFRHKSTDEGGSKASSDGFVDAQLWTSAPRRVEGARDRDG